MIKSRSVRSFGARHNKAGPAKGTEARPQAKRIKSSLLGLLTLTTATMSTIAIQATTAGAIDVTQSNVGANVNCALNGLHQNTGPVSTCYDISIRTEILVNGAVALPGASMQPGDVVTVRLTVIEEGGQNSFYEETVDGIRFAQRPGIGSLGPSDRDHPRGSSSRWHRYDGDSFWWRASWDLGRYGLGPLPRAVE